MTRFNTNVYDVESIQTEFPSPYLLSQTDDSQAQSVRSILDRFAITGIASGRDPSRDSFIGKIEEDEDIRSENVNDMLDTPDLSMMDEMEIQDYVRDNVSLTKQLVNSEEGASMADPGSPDPPPSADPSGGPVN